MSSIVPIITISGKLCSGKDTLADLLVPRLRGKVYRFTFSNLIRAEGAATVRGLQEQPMTHGEQVAFIQEELAVTKAQAQDFLDILGGQVFDPKFTLYSRTDEVRKVLQLLGSDWRPKGYWAKKVSSHAVEMLGKGYDWVVMPGSRYPEEHLLFAEVGALTVRLDITQEAQLERLFARDGLEPNPELLAHPSETLLDDSDFWLRFDVSRLSPEQCLVTVLEALAAQGYNS